MSVDPAVGLTSRNRHIRSERGGSEVKVWSGGEEVRKSARFHLRYRSPIELL